MSSSFYRRRDEYDRKARRYEPRGDAADGSARRQYMRDHAPSSSGAPRKSVYTVTEARNGKSHWTKIGVGFENADGSLNLILDAVPVNGRLQVRDYEPPANGDCEGQRSQGGTNDAA